jgi:glutamate--cysteine ligase catalytic subunit
MDIQLTDRENAAFSIFVVLLTRTILHFNLNFYMPLSKVDANMETAHHRDAVRQDKFWFRNLSKSQDSFELFTLAEIFNGTPDMVGLVPLVERYIDETVQDAACRIKLKRYTSLIAGKANGSIKTGARWIRDFVRSHADYKRDSVVAKSTLKDLLLGVSGLDQRTHLQ